ncbi:HNH endonuclease [Sinomonas terrae]|uniref:HNH endonuclease n=1 Tax=Sinomonas terrae TaxID=2908838 RepID=A0ABS9TWI9_9MICC|nr:HNH endonuclease signature motif containing protein [Sinomonas terrae]MCH6468740.1 HNH endonuclease [Sinomonas terrae]
MSVETDAGDQGWPDDWPQDWLENESENFTASATGEWTEDPFQETALPVPALPVPALPRAEAWDSVVVFGDRPDSPLFGSVGLPATEALTADAALAVAECAERVIGWATAFKLRALARLEQALAHEPTPRRDCQPVRLGGAEVHALAVAETATSTAVSEATAARLLHDAADLTGPQRPVLDALQDGRLSFQHAKVILDQSRTLPPEHAATFAHDALERATTRTGRRRTPAELRSTLRRLREREHPESIQTRKKAAVQDRGVWFAREPDGMCSLTAFLPAEAGLALYNGLDADARAARNAGRVLARAGVAATGAFADTGHFADAGPLTGTSALNDTEALIDDGTLPDHHAEACSSGAEGAGPLRLAAEERTLSQLRADALVHRLLGSLDPAFPGPFRPHVTLTIPVRTVVPTEDDKTAGDRAQNRAVQNHTAPNHAAPNRAVQNHAGQNHAVRNHAGQNHAAQNGATESCTATNMTQAESESLSSSGEAASPADSGFAELEGYGTIDSATARRLASLAPNWDRIYTDWDTGALLGMGRTAYRPPKALRRYLAYRDGGCTFPGCTSRPRACEPDHTIEWQDGGGTDPDNLALLCRKHHALKSIGAWTYHHTEGHHREGHQREGHDPEGHPAGHHRPDGILHWRSPLGRTFSTEPVHVVDPIVRRRMQREHIVTAAPDRAEHGMPQSDPPQSEPPQPDSPQPEPPQPEPPQPDSLQPQPPPEPPPF